MAQEVDWSKYIELGLGYMNEYNANKPSGNTTTSPTTSPTTINIEMPGIDTGASKDFVNQYLSNKDYSSNAKPNKDNTMLYVGIGAAVIVVGAVALTLFKFKK